MKVARTVPRGGDFSNKTTYLNRPYAALLLLFMEYDRKFTVYNKVIDNLPMRILYLSFIWMNKV